MSSHIRYIKFPEATSEMKLPDPVGIIPFVIVDDNTGLMCVRLTDQDIHEIKKNGYRLYVLAPLLPPIKDRPVHVVLFPRDPFAKTLKSNGQDKKN